MKITVPDIGDFQDIAVIEVLVQPGDTVAVETSLLTLESDKATMEVPSPVAGRIAAVHVKAGDKVSMGSHIVDLEDAATSSSETKSPVGESVVPVSPPPAASTSGEVMEVRVPDIGDFNDVAIIEVLVQPGDAIVAEAPLLTLESDKATMEVPAPFAGIVQEVLVKTGIKINMGDLIARVTVTDAPIIALQVAEEPPISPAPSGPVPELRNAPLPPVVEPAISSKPHASPSVRRFARELSADLSKIKGSGPRGRILKSDVQAYVKAVLKSGDESSGRGLPKVPPIDFSQFGDIELHPLSRIRQLSSSYLHRNWVVAPHVTQFIEADITDMEDFRQSLAEEAKKEGYRMTPLAFFIRAAVMALKQFPHFNASLHEDEKCLVYKKYFNIGVAVDTPSGLLVPVLRNADKKGLADIARELAEISARAREGKIKAEEMQGGCFTISSLGGIGGLFFTPILNLPEVAILGVSRAATRPHWDGKAFVPRLMLPLSLSYDHRVIDGADGARFIMYYSELLSDIRRLAL